MDTRSQGQSPQNRGDEADDDDDNGQPQEQAQFPTSGTESQAGPSGMGARPLQQTSSSDDNDEETTERNEPPALMPQNNQFLQILHVPTQRPPKEEQRAVAAFKVPPFEPERADKFFFLSEDRFLAIGIYDHNLRASCILQYLPTNLVEMLTQRFAEFNTYSDRYLAIKQAVLEYCKRPLWARMQQIHQLPHVGTLSPTQLMCRILALKSPDEPVYEMLKYEFLRRLPTPLFEKFKARK